MGRKILFVGGRFDAQGGAPSVYMEKLAKELSRYFPGQWEIHNGGSEEDLRRIHDTSVVSANAVFWLPDAEPGIYHSLGDIKKRNQKAMLVTHHDNSDHALERRELVAKSLDQKANLLLELAITSAGKIETTILDPLNNVFAEKESNIATTAYRLASRLEQLINVKRTGSQKVGGAIPCVVDQEVQQFLGIVREHANTFHDLIHIPNQGRSLGNISFRCERGFPAARTSDPEVIFISKRNVDKRYIGPDDLVAVRLDSDDPVKYYADGDKKPSVDGPIQIQLFKEYPKVNYILHSHTYIDGAPFTDNIYPCGAAEEFAEISAKLPDRQADKVLVNLRGHGSVAMVSDWRDLKNIHYLSREEIDKRMPWQPPVAQSKFSQAAPREGTGTGRAGRAGG